MERRRIIVSGHVQGVGFRATTRSIAADYPISGWVRNDPDRTVTIEAQGQPDQIEAFLAHVRSEMAGFIRGEQSVPIPPEPGERGFVIKYS